MIDVRILFQISVELSLLTSRDVQVTVQLGKGKVFSTPENLKIFEDGIRIRTASESGLNGITSVRFIPLHAIEHISWTE